MKRTAMVVVMLALATFGLAQSQTPATQSQPAAGAAQQGAAQPAAPQGKRPPQAKTQPEFDAYQAAAALCDQSALQKAVAGLNDPAEVQKAIAEALSKAEKAVDEFAAKFPDSEVRVLLYRTVMHAYQRANNADKMLEMGRKVLGMDPDDPEALIGVSEVLAERTRDTDLDKDQRLDEATKMAQHALETVDNLGIPAGTPQEKIDAYKAFLRSSAYSVLGGLEFSKEKYADAEGYFRKSMDALPSQLDPYVVLRLALALDKQGKYPEALKEANHAVELTPEGSTAATLARRERDRLVQLTGGSPVPAPKAPASAQNPAPPKN